MNILTEKHEENNFSGHKLNGTNYRLWKFQITAYMKSRGLTDNVLGKCPSPKADADVISKYDRNEGKAMNAIIQSLDVERANFVLTCTTTKEMMEKLSSIYEKNSDIRAMTLYEEYFACKMKDNETVASYVSKVNQMASEIEQQGEKLSDKLKMVRIISSLLPKYNNYKTVWYNTSETRSMDTLMSSLQLEEDNLKRIDGEDVSTSGVAFAVTTGKNKKRSKMEIEKLKMKTRCHSCNQPGHWSKECPNKRNGDNKSSSNKKDNKKESGLAWCVVTKNGKSESDSNNNNCWYADSGASSHMTFHREWFSEYVEYKEKCVVEVADDHCLEIHGIGTILIEARISNQWEPRRLENVLYVPNIRKNLLSTAVLTDKGVKVIIQENGCKMIDESNNVVAVGKRVEMNQLKMDFRLRIKEYANVAAVSLQHWHRRLGHINVNTIIKMCKDGLVNGVDLSNSDKFFCEDCQLGKMTRASHQQSEKRPSTKGEYMHVDLCGPMEEKGLGDIRYFMLIKDEATSFRFVYLLKSKDEVFNCLSSFIPMVKNMNSSCIKYFRFDNGTEFINGKVKSLLSKEGIQVENIVPYTPEQNGRIERDNRTIQECARTMLIASGLPKLLWPEAVRTATYLLNRSTNSKCMGSTPYEKWFDRKPYLGHIKIFGTECYVQIPKQQGRKKWDAKAKKVHLIGYEPTTKNFRLYDSNSRKVIISCDVKFNEVESKAYVVHDSCDNIIKEAVNQETKENDSNASSTCENVGNNLEDDAEDDVTLIDNDNQNGRQNVHYNLRESIKPPERLIEQANVANVIEPKTYEEAIQSKHCNEWKRAIDEEYESLIYNNTWVMVEKPKEQRIIDNRWIFKVKEKTDGSIDRFKARLVARGFTQQYGVDYDETFSPVVKFTSIRTILSLAAMNKMKLKQFDVKTAFLNGDLKEDVYMSQPIGYDDNSGRVCKLIKSLYGLKQASRCWNQKFTEFIRKFGFKVCKSDTCIFYRSYFKSITIIAIYVDDGLIAYDDETEMKSVILYLQEHFEVKVLNLNCFLGIQIEQSSNGSIRIHQEAYVNKVLNRFNMNECKVVSTPADSSQNLGDFVNDEKNEDFPYREAVGSLMYLAVGTRPDISYAVGVVSRYLEKPTQGHVNAVKRIFKYLKGSAGLGILFNCDDVFDFVGYSDADYAGDSETRRSTSGYVFNIGSGVISWVSTRQQSVSTSTTESEYIAACQGIKELIWLKNLVAELNPGQEVKAKFYMDNQSAIRLIKNPVFHKRSKHIDVQYHFIREKFQENFFELEYVQTDEQMADIFTKALIKSRHNYLCKLMNLNINFD